MAVITRIIATAALISSIGVSALGDNNKHQVNKRSPVHDFQRAAAAFEHARIAKRGGSSTTSQPKRCPAKTTSKAPTSTSSTKKPSSTGSSGSGSGSSGGSGSSSGGGGGGSSGKASPSGKKGLAWSNGMNQYLKYYVNSGVGTIYTWGASCPSEADDLGLQCASMLWGYKNTGDFQSKSGSAPILMGPNEANLAAQANLSPGDAYSLWMQYIYWQKNKYFVTPSVTSAPDGVTWMQEFFQICEDNGQGKFCGADAISLHYYGTSAQDLIDYVTNFRSQVGYPDVWLSEFACQAFVGSNPNCDSGQVWSMMEGVVGWAESTSWVKMYSPYGMMTDLGNVGSDNALMSGSGMPTSLGYYFLNN